MLSSKVSITFIISSNVLINKCEYVFNVSSILVCPKYLDSTWILAPLLINSYAQECLKSCNLICLTPAFSQLVFLQSVRALLLIGNASPAPK